MQNRRAGTSVDDRPLLRTIVLLLAIAEIGMAAYVGYALFVDDTTAWIMSVIPDLEEVWRPMVFPSAVAGLVALALVAINRWLWLGLALTLAAPLVSVWLLA